MSTSRLITIALALATVALGASDRPAVAQPDGLTCEACIVIDERGRSLWGRAPHESLPNASTTKMVTALLVVEEAGLDEEVTVSSNAADTGGGGVDLLPGDTYTVDALLHALLLSSSNDAAVALAEHVSGSEEAFVAEMNRYLDRTGADDTAFVTPHGLDAPGHVASPADLAHIGLDLLEDRVLAKIVATPETTIEGPRGPELVENRNLLLESYRGAVGIKTGMTAGAGEVLVAAAERRGDLVVAVAMRSLDAAADARALLDYGFERLGEEVVLQRGSVVSEAILDPGGTVGLVTAEPIRVLPPEGAAVRREVRLNPSFGEGVARGERVGTFELVAGDEVVATSPVVAARPVEPPDRSLLQSLVESLLSLVYATGRAIGVD